MLFGNGSDWMRPFASLRRVNGLKIWYGCTAALVGFNAGFSNAEKSPRFMASVGTVGIPLLRGRASRMASYP